MRNSDLICGFFFLALGVFILFYTLRTLPLGTVYAPEPGFYPFLVGIAMTGLAALLILDPFHGTTSRFPWSGSAGKRILSTSVGILLYVFLLESLGFPLCTFLFLFLFLKVIEEVGWVGSFLFSASTVLATYASFAYLLGVPLPRGTLLF